MSHRPRKRFGQNFLQSPLIIEQILAVLNLQKHDNVVEIGPGMGALTQPLLRRLDKLIAIEIDRDLQAYLLGLCTNGNLSLFNQDALLVDYTQFGNNLRIVGNLPYNISTPLILHLLSCIQPIRDMHFMLQKEVVERLSGQPGSKDYGRLSVVVQYLCEVDYLFDVPPESFYPQPKVDSAIVRLVPYQHSPYPTVDFNHLQKVVAMAFAMRRKTLINNLRAVMTADELINIGIAPGLRAEQLSVLDYVNLTNYLSNSTKFYNI